MGHAGPELCESVFQQASADTTLVAEAELSDGSIREVMLQARLDPNAGGLQWFPLAAAATGAADPRTLALLRLWFPPMLNDTYRNEVYEARWTLPPWRYLPDVYPCSGLAIFS